MSEQDEELEAQGVYCPDCEEDYLLYWDSDENTMYVVCDCGYQDAEDFLEDVRDVYDDTDDDRHDRMFQ